MQLSIESISAFKEGISLVLSRWSGLQMAIEERWAGEECTFAGFVAEQFADVIFSWFTHSHSKEALYIDDLEELLNEFMEDINTVLEDGSIEEVAEKLMIMYEECSEGNFSFVQSLRNLNPRTRVASCVRQVAVGDDDDDDGDDMENRDSCSMEEDIPDSLLNSKEIGKVN